MMEVRSAETGEVDALATLWYDGWQDAHAPIMPAQLAQYATRERFRERLLAALSGVRVAGQVGRPAGFCITRNDELYQLYVSAAARGSGVAALLLADGERRLAIRGVKTAWLACAMGNERAARFYEKHGWRRIGNMINKLDTPDGVFPLEVWRYEKPLDSGSRVQNTSASPGAA